MEISFQNYVKFIITALMVSVLYTCTSELFAASTYTPLVGIPGISGTPSLPEYINKIYLLTIAIGVLIAIMRIAFAGVKYSMSGVVTDKASAKSDIKGVLLGLAILLLPALVLNTINPDLLRLNFLDNLTKLDISAAPVGGVGGSTTNPAGTQTVLIPNAITGGGEYVTGSAKNECDAAGGTLTASADPAYSTCTVAGAYVDP